MRKAKEAVCADFNGACSLFACSCLGEVPGSGTKGCTDTTLGLLCCTGGTATCNMIQNLCIHAQADLLTVSVTNIGSCIFRMPGGKAMLLTSSSSCWFLHLAVKRRQEVDDTDNMEGMPAVRAPLLPP